jgi:hypothetical protein
MTSNFTQFSDLSIQITKNFTKTEKKKFGIFITPKNILEKMFDSINSYILTCNINIKQILEPSCGTCEVINYCDSLFTDVEIDGIEINETIFNSIKDLQFQNTVNIVKTNFIEYETNKKYDLIVGNPPYFVCKKTELPIIYHEFCVGRPNIFGIFIIHSLKMLSPGGILAFVVPKSFLNSLSYATIRNHIKKYCKIIDLIDFKKYNQFIDTDQSTFGLIIQKLVEPFNEFIEECVFSIQINSNFIFSTDLTQLKELFKGSTTLEKMGMKVKTGTIVWNENKEDLTDNDEETLLIYNTNISNDNTLEIKQFKNNEKGQYIKKYGKINTTLVVNRGNGNSAYKLNYAIVKKGPYLIENHLNEIYSLSKISTLELNEIYNKIINSFCNCKTQQFIELFLGNNGLSKTELETIFPIYL